MDRKRKNVTFSDDVDDQLAEQEKFFATGSNPSAHARRVGQKTFYNIKSNSNFEEMQDQSAPPSMDFDDDNAQWISGPDDDGFNDAKLFDAPEFSEKEVDKMMSEERSKAADAQQQEQAKEPEIAPAQKSQQQIAMEKLLDSCRFNFNGEVLSLEEQKELPTHLGLHHHGLEAEMAGYSFKEIFLLLRSTVPAQRVINLRILNAIVTRAKTPYYAEKFGPSVRVIDFLVEHYELPFATTMSLEERNMTAAITALQLVHNLLVPDRNPWTHWMSDVMDTRTFDNQNFTTFSEEVVLVMDKLDLFDKLGSIFGYCNVEATSLLLGILAFWSRVSERVAIQIAKSFPVMSALDDVMIPLSTKETQALSTLRSQLNSIEIPETV